MPEIPVLLKTIQLLMLKDGAVIPDVLFLLPTLQGDLPRKHLVFLIMMMLQQDREKTVCAGRMTRNFIMTEFLLKYHAEIQTVLLLQLLLTTILDIQKKRLRHKFLMLQTSSGFLKRNMPAVLLFSPDEVSESIILRNQKDTALKM